MSKRWLVVLGALLVVVGAVWTLQGAGVIGGGAMSGVKIWAVIGPFVALAGLLIAFSANRKRPSR